MATEQHCTLTAPHPPHGWGEPRTLICWGIKDFPCCTPTGPDCRDGKHGACDGRALDEHTDDITDCRCDCHQQEAS